MLPTPNIVGVIPARLGSTRLPRKPLQSIAGIPMIQRVYEGARGCARLPQVVVATDADEVVDFCRRHSIPVCLTSTDHASGSDRVWQVLAETGAEAAVNIQGDEPMVNRQMLDALVAALFAAPAVEVATLATPMEPDEAPLAATVKVVMDPRGRALYFSRAPIPFPRDGGSRYLKHLGYYAYSRRALNAFHQWRPSPLEQVEKLEQLRFLENGIDIHVALTPFNTVGIDTAEDLARAEAHFQSLRG